MDRVQKELDFKQRSAEIIKYDKTVVFMKLKAESECRSMSKGKQTLLYDIRQNLLSSG